MRFDAFGNLLVWLPLGKPVTISDAYGSYTIDHDDVIKADSLATAVGSPICLGHPGVITPDSPARSIGTVLSNTRVIPPRSGVEIECVITDKDTIRAIVDKRLVEVSPGYTIGQDGTRIYNHLALLPYGWAKGGRGMVIKLEGNTMEPQAIIDLVEKTIRESLLAIGVMEEAMDDMEQYRQEGYDRGLHAGAVLVRAKEAGYVGEDVTAAEDHLITTSFPTIKLESLDAGLRPGLLLACGNVPAPVEKTVVPPIVQEGVDPAPRIKRTNVKFSV